MECQGNQHAKRGKKRSQDHQPQRNAVNSHVVVNVGTVDPRVIDFELKTRLRVMEVHSEMQRKNKGQQ